jgi:hypothetical protein
VANHKVAVANYQGYLVVQEHLGREMKISVDGVLVLWIKLLQNNQGGYAQVIIKAFLAHLRTGVVMLTTKIKEDEKAIEVECGRIQKRSGAKQSNGC